MSPTYTPEECERWHKRTCARCQRHGWFAARLPDGYVCRTCHDEALCVRGTCPECRVERALALAGVLAHPVRAALTTLGTVLGITTLVITIGVAATAGNQIVGRFDALTATSVTVVVPEAPPGVDSGPLVTWTGPDAVGRLTGVTSVAAVAESEATPTSRYGRTTWCHRARPTGRVSPWSPLPRASRPPCGAR